MTKIRGSRDSMRFKWLSSMELRKTFEILSENGGKVFCVGGCVRDSMLDRVVTDIDLATDVKPREVKRLFQRPGFKVLSSAMKYGTITVISGKQIFQITTFRSDLETDGRHAKVCFSQSLKEDAQRRDFTINALYMNLNGEIIDPLSGLKDLRRGYVRFIGDPTTRIREDYLRILRYFRFLSVYEEDNENLDQSALLACAKNKRYLRSLSKERVWMEFKNILSSAKPLRAIKAMAYTGVLEEIFPKSNTRNLEVFLRHEDNFGIEINGINRLVALNFDNILDWQNSFPFSKKERDLITTLLAIATDKSNYRVKGFKYKDQYNQCVSALAIFGGGDKDIEQKTNYEDIIFGSKKTFPLNTDDFLRFFEPSRDLGIAVKRMKEIWFESSLEMGRKDLLTELKQYTCW